MDVFHRFPAHDKNGQCIGKKMLVIVNGIRKLLWKTEFKSIT